METSVRLFFWSLLLLLLSPYECTSLSKSQIIAAAGRLEAFARLLTDGEHIVRVEKGHTEDGGGGVHSAARYSYKQGAVSRRHQVHPEKNSQVEHELVTLLDAAAAAAHHQQPDVCFVQDLLQLYTTLVNRLEAEAAPFLAGVDYKAAVKEMIYYRSGEKESDAGPLTRKIEEMYSEAAIATGDSPDHHACSHRAPLFGVAHYIWNGEVPGEPAQSSIEGVAAAKNGQHDTTDVLIKSELQSHTPPHDLEHFHIPHGYAAIVAPVPSRPVTATVPKTPGFWLAHYSTPSAADDEEPENGVVDKVYKAYIPGVSILPTPPHSSSSSPHRLNSPRGGSRPSSGHRSIHPDEELWLSASAPLRLPKQSSAPTSLPTKSGFKLVWDDTKAVWRQESDTPLPVVSSRTDLPSLANIPLSPLLPPPSIVDSSFHRSPSTTDGLWLSQDNAFERRTLKHSSPEQVTKDTMSNSVKPLRRRSPPVPGLRLQIPQSDSAAGPFESIPFHATVSPPYPLTPHPSVEGPNLTVVPSIKRRAGIPHRRSDSQLLHRRLPRTEGDGQASRVPARRLSYPSMQTVAQPAKPHSPPPTATAASSLPHAEPRQSQNQRNQPNTWANAGGRMRAHAHLGVGLDSPARRVLILAKLLADDTKLNMKARELRFEPALEMPDGHSDVAEEWMLEQGLEKAVSKFRSSAGHYASGVATQRPNLVWEQGRRNSIDFYHMAWVLVSKYWAMRHAAIQAPRGGGDHLARLLADYDPKINEKWQVLKKVIDQGAQDKAEMAVLFLGRNPKVELETMSKQGTFAAAVDTAMREHAQALTNIYSVF